MKKKCIKKVICNLFECISKYKSIFLCNAKKKIGIKYLLNIEKNLIRYSLYENNIGVII